MDLSNVSTEELITELLNRKDLVKDDGLLLPAPWELRKALGYILCVDSMAVRYNQERNEKEVLLIQRNTGPYPGKWCAVGGTIAKGESIEVALRRHWRTELGCELKPFNFKKPFWYHQHCPPKEDGSIALDFCPEPSKESMAPFYEVEILNQPTKYGATEHGGQEARGYFWFTLKNLPAAEEFAYGFHEVAFAVLQSVRELV